MRSCGLAGAYYLALSQPAHAIATSQLLTQLLTAALDGGTARHKCHKSEAFLPSD
jgi:hypothetical protein